MTSFRRGVRLGVDVGRARVGVARCDPDGLLATPLETVARRGPDPVERVADLAREHEAIAIVVGLPVNLRGDETASTSDAREFATLLAQRTDAEVRLVDERLTTVSAHSALRSSGRSQRSSRNIVDQVAAVVLLQQALDVEKNSGSAPGFRADPPTELS